MTNVSKKPGKFAQWFRLPSRTKQGPAAECEINKIMAKYHKTGLITHVNTRTGVFMDCSNIGSYQECVERIQNANDAFYTLPATMRERFDNNPGKLIEFLQDSKNVDEAVKLGIVQKRDLSVDTPPVGGSDGKVVKPA